MENLPQHLRRPRIYFNIGFGWSTDRLYDHKVKNRKALKNIESWKHQAQQQQQNQEQVSIFQPLEIVKERNGLNTDTLIANHDLKNTSIIKNNDHEYLHQSQPKDIEKICSLF